MRRREWLRLSGAGLLGGCAGMPGGGGGKGWTEEQLERADRIARASGGKGWAAWEQGRLADSWRTQARGPSLSITKSIAGLACVKAADEGWLTADERVASTISEWQGDPGKESVALRMLLQQVAGLESGAKALYRRDIADKGRVAVRLRQVDVPGTLFRYGPACWEVLAELLQRKCAARGESLEKFLHRGVMRPLGLNAPEWRSDAKGRFFLSTGAELSVTDLGRLGRTLGELVAGRDAGGLTAVNFREMSRPSGANPIFGAGIWRNRNAGKGDPVEIEDVLDPPRGPDFWRRVSFPGRQPSSMLALVGSAGQRVFVWPDGGRVVARIGYSPSWKDAPFLAEL